MDTSRVKKAIENGFVPVITGFQGVSPDLDMMTLGRGGSDTSGVAVGGYMGARGRVYLYRRARRSRGGSPDRAGGALHGGDRLRRYAGPGPLGRRCGSSSGGGGRKALCGARMGPLDLRLSAGNRDPHPEDQAERAHWHCRKEAGRRYCDGDDALSSYDGCG